MRCQRASLESASKLFEYFCDRIIVRHMLTVTTNGSSCVRRMPRKFLSGWQCACHDHSPKSCSPFMGDVLPPAEHDVQLGLLPGRGQCVVVGRREDQTLGNHCREPEQILSRIPCGSLMHSSPRLSLAEKHSTQEAGRLFQYRAGMREVNQALCPKTAKRTARRVNCS